MSWFGGGGSNQFDELVERATSELLPQGQEDLALNLEVCDLVRSKQVQPKDAARALRKRLGHKNPNVQLLALRLIDTVVKNGGHHFLLQVASREFLEDIVSIIRLPTTNAEVKSKALSYLQSWACAFQGKPELVSVAEQVRSLKADNFMFPDPPKTSTFMVDTSAPPDWTDSDVCMRCRTMFTMTNRKHHCRNCGQTFCGACSSKSIPLPCLGINQAVRVCDGCYAKEWSRNNLTGSSSLSALTGGVESAQTSSATPPRRLDEDDEDDDLRRAIEASLKESSTSRGKAYAGDGGGGGGRGGYMPPQQADAHKASTSKKAADIENDPDLAAAIAASLRDVRIGKQSSDLRLGTPSASQLPVPKVIPFNDLTPTEKENISMFADLVDRINEDGGDVVGDQQIQNLYELIGSLQPQLIRALEDAIGKHKTYYDLHERISRAVKIYDSLLEQRLSASSYGPQSMHSQLQSSKYSDISHRASEAPKPNAYPTPYAEGPSASAPYQTPTGSAFSPYTAAGAYPAASSPYQLPVVPHGYRQAPQQQPQSSEQPYAPFVSLKSSASPHGVSAGAYPVSGPHQGDYAPTPVPVPESEAAPASYYGWEYSESGVQRHAYSGETPYPPYQAHSGPQQTARPNTYVPGPAPPHAEYQAQPRQQQHQHQHQQHQHQQEQQQQPQPQPEPPKEVAPLIEF